MAQRRNKEGAKAAPSDTIEVDALLHQMVNQLGSVVTGLGEVGTRLGGLEKAISQQSFVTIASDADKEALWREAKIESRAALGSAPSKMGVIDALTGHIDGLREARYHLEAFSSRIGILEQPAPINAAASQPPRSLHISELLAELADERFRLRDLISRLASEF